MIWKRDEVNTNNGVKWRRFIVPKKVEQINDHLFGNMFAIWHFVWLIAQENWLKTSRASWGPCHGERTGRISELPVELLLRLWSFRASQSQWYVRHSPTGGCHAGYLRWVLKFTFSVYILTRKQARRMIRLVEFALCQVQRVTRSCMWTVPD